MGCGGASFSPSDDRLLVSRSLSGQPEVLPFDFTVEMSSVEITAGVHACGDFWGIKTRNLPWTYSRKRTGYQKIPKVFNTDSSWSVFSVHTSLGLNGL